MAVSPFERSIKTAAVGRGLRVAVVSVGPPVAEEWLTHNTANRRITPSRVARMSLDMATHRWYLSGEPIIFADDGTLHDGQHRLLAVQRSGATVDFLVVWGVPRESSAVLDTAKRRGPSDVLYIAGEAYGTVLDKVLRRIYVRERGKQPRTGNVMENPDYLDTLQAHPEARDAAAFAAANAKRIGMTPATVGFTYWLLRGVDSTAAFRFFDGLASGAGLPSGSPILALRNTMARLMARQPRPRDEEQIAMTVAAWNLYRQGQSAEWIGRRRTGKMPEPR